MQKIILIIAAFVLFASAPLFSQADSTKYINGLPVGEDDTATHVQHMDVEPYNRQVAVPIKDLPAKLREVLDEERIYQGWQDTTIYYHVNTGMYIVPIRYRDGVKIFGLNKNGNPVSFREVSGSEDQEE